MPSATVPNRAVGRLGKWVAEKHFLLNAIFYETGNKIFNNQKMREILKNQHFSHLIIMPQTGIEPVRVSLPTGF